MGLLLCANGDVPFCQFVLVQKTDDLRAFQGKSERSGLGSQTSIKAAMRLLDLHGDDVLFGLAKHLHHQQLRARNPTLTHLNCVLFGIEHNLTSVGRLPVICKYCLSKGNVETLQVANKKNTKFSRK